MEIGTQTAVYTKDTSVDNGTQGEIIKHLATPPPHIGASIFPLALIVEPIHLCNLPGFVVSSNKGDAFGVADFQGQQQEECFDAVETPINEIAYTDRTSGDRYSGINDESRLGSVLESLRTYP